MRRTVAALITLLLPAVAAAQPSPTFTNLTLTGTGAAKLNVGTTTQRPDSGNAGEVRYNSTTGRYEFGIGGSWMNHVRLSGDTMTGTLQTAGAVPIIVGTGGNIITMTPGATGATAATLGVSGSGNFNLTALAGGITLSATSAANIKFTPGSTGLTEITRGALQLDAAGISSTYNPVYSSTVTAGANVANLWSVIHPSGTVKTGDVTETPLNFISISNDSVDASGADSNHKIVTGFLLLHHVITGAVGTRKTFRADLSIDNTTGNLAAGFDPFFTTTQATIEAHAPACANPSPCTLQTAIGHLVGNFIDAELDATSANYFTVKNTEWDLGIATGGSARRKLGLNIVLSTSDAVQGATWDCLICLANAGATFSRNTVSVGGADGGTSSPFGTAGDGTGRGSSNGSIVFGAYLTDRNGAVAQAAVGYDFNEVDAQWATFRSRAFYVGPTGIIHPGVGAIAPTATGISIDAPGNLGVYSGVQSGGSGCANGNILDGPANSKYIVTTSVAGVVTVLNEYRVAYVFGSTPSNPVSLIPDPLAATAGCTGVTINYASWTAGTVTQIGATTNTLVGTGSALATNATVGFPLLPTTTGAPTGTVGGAGQSGYVVRTDNHKICHTEGSGTWYYADGTACS